MKNVNEKPSERSIYIWNITGSIANALFSIVTLMIVTRMLDDNEADIFSIAWTISQLMATIGTFQIRMYQATDVTGVFSFRQYWKYRSLTVILMLISSYIYIFIRGYTGEKKAVVLFVCVFRAIDSFADVYEGWFQQKERLDLSGKALTYRIIIAVIAFGTSVYFTRNLMISVISLVVAYTVCLFVFDLRYQHSVHVFREEKSKENIKKDWILNMTKEGLPLFINAFLMLSIMNAPKMVIDTFIDQGNLNQGLQTVFNIIFMPASFLNLAYIVFRPLITRMAIMWNAKKTKEFVRTLLRILASLILIGIGLLLGSALLGIPVLSMVYSVDLSEYKKELLIIIVGGCIYTFAAVLDNALVVIRHQYALIVVYGLTYLYINNVVEYMIGVGGMMGAALSYASAMLVFFAVMATVFLISFLVEKEN